MMTDQTFSHFTKEPLTRIESRYIPKDPSRLYYKPTGLWLSVDGPDDWPEWCKMSDYDGLGTRYIITLRDANALLWLRCEGDLYEFTHQYERKCHRWSYDQIDWPQVTRDYPGIIIAPYSWSCRLDEHTRWYYSWDCASGCVWNADAIDSFTLADTECVHE